MTSNDRPRPSGRGRRLLVVGVAALVAVALAGCGSSSKATTPKASTGSGGGGTTSVNVAYVPIPLFEPLFVAQAKGYFAREGIDVHLQVVANGQTAISLAATNKVQVVLGGFSAGMFNAIHAGLDFTVVGSMAEEAPGPAANGLVVAASMASKITSPADLKGMKIAVDGGAGSTGAYLLALALRPYHVTLDQVTLVNLEYPEMGSALRSGAVAAAYLSTPFTGAAISAGEGKLLVGAPVGVSPTGVIYGGDFARTPAAQRFFDALVMAAGDLQGKAATSSANLHIVASATSEQESIIAAEPANVFDPKLAPPSALLADMQDVFIQAKQVTYSAPIAASKYIDGSFSAHAS